MAGYTKHVAPKRQHRPTEKALPEQKLNSAGGYTFEVDPWTRLNRFLILGCEKGTYYASEQKLTVENFKNLQDIIALDGKRAVDEIVAISTSKPARAPKNESCVFALAVCSVLGDKETKTHANKMMNKVCRIPTDMYLFVDAVDALKYDPATGKSRRGKGLHRAIAGCFHARQAKVMALHACKYPQRKLESMNQKWSLRDLLRMIKMGPNRRVRRYANVNGEKTLISDRPDPILSLPSEKHGIIFKYITKGIEVFSQEELEQMSSDPDLRYIVGHELAKKAKNEGELLHLIKDYNLVWESIPNDMRSREVRTALLDGMPIGALLRSLGALTAKNVFAPMANATQVAVAKLTNAEALQYARIHPIRILIALSVYKNGKSDKGRLTWKPNQDIVAALDQAFYLAFPAVVPTGKKILWGIDVSSSMFGNPCIGSRNVDAATAAAAMAMLGKRTEKNSYIMCFAQDFREFPLSPTASLDEVKSSMNGIGFGGTDCALPVEWAIKNGIKDIDAFVILTDGETWYSERGRHPYEAMNEYRNRFNPNAKHIMMAFCATDVTICKHTGSLYNLKPDDRPKDQFTLDVAGLDSAAPTIISDFVSGRLYG